MNCHLKHVVEGKAEEKTERTGRREIRRKQLMDSIFMITERRKATRIGHILCRNCLLKHVVEGKAEEKTERTERRERRRKQLMDYVKEKRRS